MTVEQLIKKLLKLPMDAKVVLQSDAEGNGHEELADVGADAIWRPADREIIDTRWSWEDACFDSAEEWEAFKAKHPRCCVLSP